MMRWLADLSRTFRRPEAEPTIEDCARAMSRRAAECRREARSAYVRAHIAALQADIAKRAGKA